MSDELMTPCNMLEAAESAASTAFMEFTAAFRRCGNDATYCLVEGYDAPYYSSRVSTYFDPYVFIDCHNKHNVIGLHDDLQSRPTYNDVKRLCFVDRDYDDNSGLGPDFCVTEGYSVENYYGGEKFIENFLLYHRHLTYKDNKEDIEKILDDYRVMETDFINATKRFCAWYSVASPRATYKNPDYKYRFPDDLASLTKDGVTDKGYTREDLNVRYQLSSDVTESEYDEALSRIRHIGDIRGKFVLKFMVAYLDRLARDGKRLGLLAKTFQLPSDETSFMSYYSAYALTPESLRDYLRQGA